MMLLKEMFTKPIDRDLKGVIKVGQDDDSNVWQELDEYVVTTELQKHFKTFFSNYASGINQETDKMGVWISGYFGSGKSHFLKILAYLLENRKINGKQSIEFFEESGKIKDSFDLANMKKAASVSTDVILFNIGAKNQSTDSAQDPILKVFLRVFNEHLGLFGANPHIADLERQLFRSGLFDKFKSQFREVTGNEWELTRPEFKFLTGKICTILSQIGFMSEEIAKNWCAHVLDPYELSIEDFAKMVAEYLATNPRDHHLVFLIDEIGQFIGEDVRLMLSLQTVVEQLGIWCKGKVWVIVTSQEAIDKITDVKGKDFSKIQGRFDTRLNLSSANVDEVIRKRILEKKNAAIQSLAVVYEQKATQIKNSICFDDNIEKKLYSCPDDFISIYPFVPYQFKLLSAVLTAIREHGSSGKHLSEGERSMLAMFKESAVRVMDNELGQLIPFNFFYDNVESYLDSGHKRVISDALGNERINPSHEDFCFDVEVLKVLFLIKYVKEISATANNIISLMVSEIDEDRVVLTKKVEKALERLESQTLIQRNGDRYVFLSSEEQEVNQEIKNIDVVSSEIVRETGTNFFGDLLQLDSFTYQKKYPFGLNQYVDSTELRVRGSNKLGIRLITPYYDNGADKSGISLMSVQEKNIIVFLPQNCPVLKDMELAQKIQKYLHRNGTTNLSRYPDIREAKAREYNDRIVSAKYAFNQTLTQAEIYVAGSLVSANGNNIKERIQTALKLLVERVCDKIGYITNFADEEYVLTLLRDQKNGSILPEGDINPQALRELSDYVERQTIGHKRISMKSIMEYFREIPYCFLELDIIALMARLFVSAEIAMTLSGEQILLQNHSPEKIFNYMSKKEYWEKLLINKRQKATELQINDVKEILQEVFNASPSGDDENSVFNCFEENRKNLEQSLKKISTQNQNIQYGLSWPGMDVVKRGQELLQKLEGISEPERLFAALTVDRNDWLDFGEDYDAVRSFYDTRSPSAKQTFGASLDYVIQYEQCKNLLIGNTDLLEVVEKMRVILDMKIPYGKIKELPPLNQAFRSLVTNIVESQRNVAISVVDTYKREFSAKKDTMKDCIIEKYLGELNSIQKQILHSSSIRDFPYFMESARHIMREMEREKVESIPEENRASDLPIKEISQTKPAPKLVILGTLLPQKGWVIHSEEDIDRHLAELKTRLCEELNSDGLRVSW